MGAELELELEDEASIFSASTVRARLAVSGKPVSAFRDTLAWGRDRLYGLFKEGTPAESLVRARSFLVDEVLREAWLKFLPEQIEGLALVAVGGYGRGELLPHSDIDLLLLHEAGALDKLKPQLEQFMAFLWDMGLEVGSSVRSPKDCAKLAAADITIMTTLLESRQLMGDPTLFGAMQDALGPNKVWPVAEFYKAKVEEQRKRHAKYDDTGYKLEPNVKESPGGLRDIHTIAWVAKRHFGSQTLHELKEKGFLTAQECADLFAGQDFLWRVRFAIHMLTGRKEDRLLFDHQIKVAQLFGYVDDEQKNRGVEQFMQLYYRTIKSLSCLNDLLLQLFDEAILHKPDAGWAWKINARFQSRGGYIEARSHDVFRRNPYALIEIFLLLQKNPKLKGVRAETLRLIRRDRKLVDEGLRDDIKARELFLEMFREGTGLTRNLRRMNRYGVLGRYLPGFGNVIGLMQYDLFHTLTVDEHVLYVVRNLRRFAMKEFKTELPFCNEVFLRIPKPELLYLGGLFHDIAKGRGGDHSEIGSGDAEKFCLDHGLSHVDAELVAWLVKNHLLMSLTAQKQDVSDPEVVRKFAERVGDRQRLDYIFLLTCADIRATNPALWNSWRESLLTELYRTTARALERGLHDPIRMEEAVQEQKVMALALLKKSKVDAVQAEAAWSKFNTDYFLRHSPAELAWHLPEITRATDATLPLILVQPVSGRGTTVFIYMRDRDHLFGLATGVLARLGLNILDARINTTADGFVLDSFAVVESDGAAVEAGHRHDEIRDSLRKVLADAAMTVVEVNRKTPARLKHFTTPTTVFFSQDSARHRTLLELVTADRPGLLSWIGRVFHRRGILLDAAKINTVGERAEDVFFVTDREHQPITDEATLNELREVITRTLNRGEFIGDEFKLTAIA